MPDFATLWPSLADPAPVDSAWPSLSFTDEETKRVREKEQKALELKKRIDSDPWSVVKDKTALPGDKLMAAMAIQEKRINAPATAPALASAGGPMPGTMYGSLASARSDVAELATAPTSERGLAASMRFGNASRQEADPLYKPKKASIVGGWLAGAEAVDAKLSLDRINAGKADDMDYWRVASFLKQQEQKQDYTTGQTIFDGVLETGSFIGDIMATGGLSKIADKATKKLVTKTAEKYVTKGAAKLIGKGAGAGVGVAAQTALMPDKIAADAGMRYYQGDDALTAIAKGTASTAIDVGTERMGGLFAKRYLPKALRKAVWVNPRSALGKSGAFQGPGEMLEESYSDVAKGATGLAPDFGATGQAMVGNFRPLAETAAVVGLTSGLGAAPNLARDSQKPLKFDTTQKLPTAAEVNEAMMQPETAQAWATANPEAAARMATIDSPSRSQWEELTGEKMRGNPASRKAFADNVRAAIQPAPVQPTSPPDQPNPQPERDPRWHYGTTPWKPEPSPESIADTVGTTPIAADPTPGRQTDVVPVEQVTAFSTPKVDYNLKDAPKPQDSVPIKWRDDNSGFTYGKLRGREVTVKQGNPFAASSGEGATWNVLVDSQEHGPDFATHAEAKAHAEKLLRHQLMPADHPAKLLDELSYMRFSEWRDTNSDIREKIIAAGVPAGAVDAMVANSHGVDEGEVDSMIEKYLSTDDQSAWARENLPRWITNRILNERSVNDYAERIDDVVLDHPAAWDWTWEQLQDIKQNVTHDGADATEVRLKELMQQLEAFAAKDEADPIRLQQSHEYSPITPEQRAPVATATQETANALNPPVSDKTPTPVPEQPPAQEAVAPLPPQRRTTITAGEKQYPAEYRVVDLESITPSHDFWRGTPKDNVEEGKFPANLQPRDYNDPNEKMKVRERSGAEEAHYFLEDTQRADGGPPTVSNNGIVFNGNGRAMMLQMAAGEGRYDWYKNALKAKAQQFGIDPSEVEGKKHPVLVRVVDIDPTSKDAQAFAAAGNTTATMAQSSLRTAASMAKLIDADLLESVPVGEESSFSDMVAAGGMGKDFRETIFKAMPVGERPRYFNSDHSLTNEGKDLVRNMLLTRILPVDVVEKLNSDRKQLAATIEKSLPVILRMSRKPVMFDQFKKAIAYLADHPDARDKGTLEREFRQKSMLGDDSLSPREKMFAEFAITNAGTPNKFRDRLRRVLADASAGRGLFKAEVSDTATIIAEALDVPLRKGPAMVQSPTAMGITPGGVQIKLGGIGSWLAKWFKSAGHLPDSAYARKTLKDADVASEEKAVRNNANDLRDALRAELGTSKLLPSGQKKVDAALKGDAASLTGFSPRVQKAITAMRKHIDALSERLIASGVLDEQLTITVDENMGSYVTRSYQAHDDQSYKPSEKVRNDAFAHLQAAFPNENAQQINNRLDDMLAKAKEGAPVADVKRSMLGAKDGGILKARKDIAPEIRAFLGEYNDPFVNYAKSATKMAALIANQEFLNDVKFAGQGKFFFDRDDPNRPTGYNVEFAAEGSEALSPLNGLMTTPEIKQAFADINPQHITDGWLRTLLGANYVVKYGKTVLSPMTHQRNLTGNVMFAVQNGHWNVPMMATAAKATGGELAASLPEAGRALVSRFAGDGKAWREAFQRYTKLGIVGDGIHSGELKAALRDVTDTTKAAVEAGMFGYAVKGLRGGAEMATTLYQLEDAIWKIYAFENERARYKSAYEKAGQPKSDAELDAMSAAVVSDTYPTYSKLPRAITTLRRIPFIGSFVSFPAEVIRTGVMSIKLGVKEFNDPALKSIGAQRLAGNLVAIAATTALGAASQWLFDIDDEEEEALRKFLPPWQENAEILWLSKPKDGKAMYIDLSYTMPHSMLKEPYTAAMRGDDVYDSLKKGTFQFAEPFISEEILAGKLYDIARNTKGGESRSEVYPTYGTDAEKAAAITNHLYGAFEPGGMTSARRIMAGVTGAGGKVYNPYTEAAAVATGQRIQETDVAQSLKFDAKNYRNAERKTTSMFSAPFQREGKVSDEQIAKSYNSATTAASAQFEKLHQAAVSAKKLGVSEDEIRSILAANGVSKTRHDDPDSDDPTVKLPSEIDRVLAGKYEPYRISRNLYDHVSEMPGGKERLAAYEKASGDKESVAELHRIDVTNAANALSREKPDKPGDTDADRQKWFADRQEAIQWLRAKGVSGQDVLTTYLPELRKIKTDTTRAEKRDRLKAALKGL